MASKKASKFVEAFYRLNTESAESVVEHLANCDGVEYHIQRFLRLNLIKVAHEITGIGNCQ